ncbi:hypothetical protein D3OALGB2SA_4066 [Olavius algarvensis associated proteobacterium Delta 3]|nr:hypothetical protein D3OALGB2SA_4066 [Olavius algarvensis associated proteobacterium Delta 3]
MKAEQVDLVVIGAGPAGLAAAAEVSIKGARVVVLDENPVPGGRLPSQVHLDVAQLWRLKRRWVIGRDRALRLVGEAREAGTRIRCGRSVWHVFPTGSTWHVCTCPTVPGKENPADGFAYDARALVIATGAVQKPLPFSGWTLPGVFTAGAVQTMVNVNGVLPGKRVLMVGVDPLGVSAAQLLAACGVQVVGVVLPPDNAMSNGACRPSEGLGDLVRMTLKPDATVWKGVFNFCRPLYKDFMRLFPISGLSLMGAPLMLRRSLKAAHGQDRVVEATIADLDANGNERPGQRQRWFIDAVVTACGLSPLVETAQIAGCPIANVPDLGGWVPLHGSRQESPLPGLFVAGSITGVAGAAVAETQGRIAGINAAQYLRLVESRRAETDVTRWHGRLEQIRAATPGFLPDIANGRAEMAKQWRAYCH